MRRKSHGSTWKAETQTFYKPYPRCSNQLEELKIPSTSQRSSKALPHIGHSQFLGPAPKRWAPQNVWLWSSRGLLPIRAVGLWQTEEWFLKAMVDSPAPGPSTEAASRRAPRLYVKETLLLFLKDRYEGAGILLRRLVGAILLLSFCLAKEGGWAAFFFLFLFFFFLFLTLLFLWFSFYFPFLNFFFLLFFSVSSFALLLCFAPASGCHCCTLQRASISQRGTSMHICCPCFTFGDMVFLAASQVTPLDHLPLEARGTWIPGSHGTCNSWTDSSWQPKTPRALHRPYRSFWERALCIVPGSLAWWSGFWFIGA